MKKGNSFSNRSITVLLGLTVIYFTQLYPYLHFHHTHNEDDLRIVVSSHPIDHDREDHTDHHHGNHHHENDDHFTGNWNYVNPVQRLPLALNINVLLISNIAVGEEPEQVTVVQQEIKHPPPRQILISPEISRGPPDQS